MPGTYEDKVNALGLTPEQTQVSHFGLHTVFAIETLAKSGLTVAQAYDQVKGLREHQIRAVLDFKLSNQEAKSLSLFQIEIIARLVRSNLKTSVQAYQLVEGLEDHQVTAVVDYSVPRDVARGLSTHQVGALRAGWNQELVTSQLENWDHIVTRTKALQKTTPKLELTRTLLDEINIYVTAYYLISQTITSLERTIMNLSPKMIECGALLIARGWGEGVVRALYKLCEDLLQDDPSGTPNDAMESILSTIQKIPNKSFKLPPQPEGGASAAPKEAAASVPDDKMASSPFSLKPDVIEEFLEAEFGPFMQPRCVTPDPDRDLQEEGPVNYQQETLEAREVLRRAVKGLTTKTQLELYKLGVSTQVLIDFPPPSDAYVDFLRNDLKRPGFPREMIDSHYKLIQGLTPVQLKLCSCMMKPKDVVVHTNPDNENDILRLATVLRARNPQALLMISELTKLNEMQRTGVIALSMELHEVQNPNFDKHILDLMLIMNALNQDVVSQKRGHMEHMYDSVRMKVTNVVIQDYEEAAAQMIMTYANLSNSKLNQASIESLAIRQECNIM